MEVHVKTIVIPKKILRSFVFAIPLSILFFVVFHLFGKWQYLEYTEPPSSWKMSDSWQRAQWLSSPKIYGWKNSCVLSSSGHEEEFSKTVSTSTDYEGTFNSYRLKTSLKNTFEDWFMLILLSLFFALVIYLMNFIKLRVKFV
jgi:hypothetical protein